jgi:hypothetical protein
MNPSRVPLRLLASLALLALLAGCDKNPTRVTTPAPSAHDYYVDAAAGLDANLGTAVSPFKTITHAVAVAGAGKSIAIAPGTYDAGNGETFPIVLQAGQSLVGDVANRGNGTASTRVRGLGSTPGLSGAYSTIVAAEGASIRGLRIGAPGLYNHWAIYARNASVTLTDNTLDSLTFAGVYLTGTGTSLVSDNVFNCSGYGAYLQTTLDTAIVEDNDFRVPNLPVTVAGQGSRAIVRANRIAARGQLGIQVASGVVWIEDNVFDNPGGYAIRGAIYCGNPDAMPFVRGNSFTCALGICVDEGLPDLGSAGSPGNNLFTGVTGAAVQHAGSGAITAIGNTWRNTPPTPGADIVVTGTGSVRWGTDAANIYP